MLRLQGIVGHRADASIASRLHDLAHRGGIEYLIVGAEDAARRRLRLVTDRGTDCALSLAREEQLADGAVILLEADRAIVTRVGEQPSLRLRPRDIGSALLLGWHAGNLHWRVRLEDGDLVVAVDGAEADHRARIASLLADGRVTIVDHADP